jgi:THAP4-like, heme-binding beta-barrel domain
VSFTLPDGLAPEVYPLAWLVGSWRGEGVISYPGIEPLAFIQDVTFDHDGGPYLRYESTIRVLEPVVPETVPEEWSADDADAVASDDAADAGETTGEGVDTVVANADTPPLGEAEMSVWSTETGYWRVPPTRPDDLPEGKTPLEVLIADPAGRVTLYLGVVGNGRVDLTSDLIARTSTAADVAASNRLYGLVEGRLMWVWEIAAFGQPLQSYVSANLMRVDG